MEAGAGLMVDAGVGLMGDGDAGAGLVGAGDAGAGLVGDGDEVAGRTFAKIMIIMRRIMAPIKIPPSPAFQGLMGGGVNIAVEDIYYNKRKL
jgi:hypothetical protein